MNLIVEEKVETTLLMKIEEFDKDILLQGIDQKMAFG